MVAFEPVYSSLYQLARVASGLLKHNIIITGAENIPPEGGALFCINHTGYVDFYFTAYALARFKRHPRFMAKQEVFENPVAGPIMRALHHIPVDRIAGQESVNTAIDLLKKGEAVAIFPEGTMSNSFEIKELKTGAVRMAQGAGVKIYPTVIWGAQRVYRRNIKLNLKRHLPIMLHFCEPMEVDGKDPEELTRQLRATMQKTLEDVQQRYNEQFGPFEPGLPWMPARLGGSAPTLEEAQAADDKIDESRERANAMMRNSYKAAREVHSVILHTNDASTPEASPEAQLSRLTSMRAAAEKLSHAAEQLVEAAKNPEGEVVKRKAGAGSLRNMTETVASAAMELEVATVLSERKASRLLEAGSDSVTDFATGFRHRTAKSLHAGAEYLLQKAQSLRAHLAEAEEATRQAGEERQIRHAIAREARTEKAAADAVWKAIKKEQAAVKQAEREAARALANAARATEEVMRAYDHVMEVKDDSNAH